jgi:hypothetical protein
MKLASSIRLKRRAWTAYGVAGHQRIDMGVDGVAFVVECWAGETLAMMAEFLHIHGLASEGRYEFPWKCISSPSQARDEKVLVFENFVYREGRAAVFAAVAAFGAGEGEGDRHDILLPGHGGSGFLRQWRAIVKSGSMPGGGAGARPADALAGGREFEHHVDGGTARIGMIAGEVAVRSPVRTERATGVGSGKSGVVIGSTLKRMISTMALPVS